MREDIAQLGDSLLTPFNDSCLKVASYDIRVGSLVVLAYPKEDGGIKATDLLAVEGEDTVTIPPGQACVVRSLEKIQMPLHMKGRLSLRSYWATQLLSYTGGPIDPGYNGFLFFPITNISDSPVSLRYGEPLVTAEFIRLATPASSPYHKEEIVTLRNPPGIPAKKPYNPVEMTIKIEQLDRRADSWEPLIESTRRIMDAVLLALVAGVAAGAIAGSIVYAFTELSTRASLLGAIGLGIGLAFIATWLLRRIRK